MKKQGARSSTAMVVQSVAVGARTYELRYNRCGKENCRVCYRRGADYSGPPGHGPYWYLCFSARGRWRRIYIGKVLDTDKWITPEGDVDWAAYRARRAQTRAAAAAGKTAEAKGADHE